MRTGASPPIRRTQRLEPGASRGCWRRSRSDLAEAPCTGLLSPVAECEGPGRPARSPVEGMRVSSKRTTRGGARERHLRPPAR
jgi:hypothetical protein